MPVSGYPVEGDAVQVFTKIVSIDYGSQVAVVNAGSLGNAKTVDLKSTQLYMEGRHSYQDLVKSFFTNPCGQLVGIDQLAPGDVIFLYMRLSDFGLTADSYSKSDNKKKAAFEAILASAPSWNAAYGLFRQ